MEDERAGLGIVIRHIASLEPRTQSHGRDCVWDRSGVRMPPKGLPMLGHQHDGPLSS